MQFYGSVIFLMTLCNVAGYAQSTNGWLLKKMPDSLEFHYALSALPPHLRDRAAVYLLDPNKGYYMARKGSNGFSAFLNRTQWEHTEFVQDVFEPISYDSIGSTVYLRPFFDVAAMRATGKFTPEQIKDTVITRVGNGTYKAAPRVGISYMLSPLLRNRVGTGIATQVMPHYMFYAPGLDDRDIGGGWVTGGHQPFAVNSGPLLDRDHSIFNYIIIAAGETEKAKIIDENKELMEKLAAYRPFFKVETAMNIAHHH